MSPNVSRTASTAERYSGGLAEQQVVQRFLDARRELERVVVLRLDRRRRHAHHVLLLGAQVQVLGDAEHDLAHQLPEPVQYLLGLLLVEPLGCRPAPRKNASSVGAGRSARARSGG